MSDTHDKAEYDLVRELFPEIPAWDDLTEEQKEHVMLTNKRKRDYFNRLGESIRIGIAPPDIKEF